MTLPEQIHLNLARKWRPQTFDTVLGQDVPMRMLKNSLYLNKFFPVYLFAGQRGCGKTTSARIFAAAANCLNLPAFQLDPKLPIPCLNCTSCLAMHNGNHPDFIEIDAASHTGVDNVRSIIDSSSYMPLLGKRKIYLIDEAHMLSKAAFNALLKLLEEPPKNVIFMLATTESGKIPTTVLSRCFQLIFPALPQQMLRKLLTDICTKEGVSIEDVAVDMLLQETEGSARDAINLLERVRFSGEAITEELVISVLGKISNKNLVALMNHIVDQQPSTVLQEFQTMGAQGKAPAALWDGLIHLAKTLLWIKYGVTDIPLEYQQVKGDLLALAEKGTKNRFHAILTLLWNQERIFNQTNKKQLFVETVLLQLCEQTNIADLQDLLKPPTHGGGPSAPPSAQPSRPHPSSPSVVKATAAEIPSKIIAPRNVAMPEQSLTPPSVPQLETTTPEQNNRWLAFVEQIKITTDQLLFSIFSQAILVSSNDTDRKVTIALSSNSSFFKSKIEESTTLWRPFLQGNFNGCNNFAYSDVPCLPQQRPTTNYRDQATTEAINNSPGPSPAPNQPPRFTHREKDSFLVIKDPQQWPTASLLLETFSGKIKKVSNSQP